MRRRYHLPVDVTLPENLSAVDGRRLRATVLAAIRRAVGDATPGETAPAPAAPRPEPREPAAGTARSYAVPSYDKNGERVGIPLAGPRPAPTAPVDARLLFNTWHRYWADRHNRAHRRSEEIRRSLWRANVVAYSGMMRRFDLGARGALGPEYQAAVDERDACSFMVSASSEVLTWLEVQEKSGRPVTFEQLNDVAWKLAKAQAFLLTWVEPVAIGFLGAAAARAGEIVRPPAEPEVPPTPGPPGGGWIGRTVRNALANAMIGLSEAEPATQLPGGSPAVTERLRPGQSDRPAATATEPASAPRRTGPAVAAQGPSITGTGAGQSAAARSRADDAALDHTFDLAPSNATIAPGQGVVTTAPEVAAGVTPAQIAVLRQVLGHRLTDGPIRVLAAEWNAAARPGDAAILNAGNSRYLFDLHRNRFWRRVAANPAAAALLRDAGFTVSGGAPYLTLNGRRVTVTIDHVTERRTAPNLSLTASNLRLSLSRENSVVLRLLNQLDPFR